jgi:serine/threonine protein kinase
VDEIGEGSVLGAYRLVHRLGSGGMGTVWMAEHTMLGRRAAVKLLHDALTRHAEMVTRFFNEARAATAISDPGIVQVFDFGQLSDGTVYIVMELLDGEPLDRRLARGALGLGQALHLMRQVAGSLGAAHAAGIVHRDLKPENIFIVHDPEVSGGERTKILDFGIAKLASHDSGVKTQTAALMGTPVYMSPEQCRGAGSVDQRADIYSLGCVLFALVTGRPPFVAEGSGEVIAMHLREQPPLPSSIVHRIPKDVDALIMRCLAKDADHRFASGAALASALGMLLARPEIAMMQASTQHVSIAVAPTTLSGASAELSAVLPPSRFGIRAALIAVTAAIVAILATALGGTSSDSTMAAQVDARDAVPTDAAPDAPLDESPDEALDIAPTMALPEPQLVEPPRPKPRPRPEPPPTPSTPPQPPRADCVELDANGLPKERFKCGSRSTK